jgi:xanthine dehydrogenase YagT iron-sulfur-binding subunit
MPEKKDASLSFSRRTFLKSLGTTAAASATAGVRDLAAQIEALDAEKVYGPGPVPLSLTINGKAEQVEVEPRATLLEVLRDHLPYPGAKEVCGRATCGACTVMVDGKPVYGCMKLAIEAQGADVTTVEGLASGSQLSTLQEAFIQEDGLMCGYCTSGFLVTLTGLLQENPKPSEAEIRKACSGNLCRCGTYPRIFKSAQRAAGLSTESQTEVIRWRHG